jgi:hypothetical protein
VDLSEENPVPAIERKKRLDGEKKKMNPYTFFSLKTIAL